MIIDAGNNEDSDLIKSYLLNQGIQQLDVVVGTHPHEDHIGSLDTVIKNFDVKKVYMPKVSHTTKTFEDVLLAIKDKSLKVSTPIAGETFNLGEAKFTILGPNNSEYKSLNDYSIIIKLEYGNNSFLFTGDAEVKSEKEMLNKGYNLDVDVLKVGHHGSTTSTSDEFLSAVSPKYAVISCEKDNDYGHPHKEIIEKLNKQRIEIYRTDQIGTIVLSSDGENITLGGSNNVVDNGTIKDDIKTGVIISDIDKKAEVVYLKNTSSENINLKGWKLLSIRGYQEYIIPDQILNAGATLSITSGDMSGDLNWGSTNIWNNTESDPGELYDDNGKLIYRFED